MSMGTVYQGARRFEQGAYYELSHARLRSIARAAGLAYQEVARICLDQDWSEGAEHQRWLETAPCEEIAAWVRAILADEMAED